MNQRMVALVKMLSSPNEGEVVNAARLIGKMLAAQGLDWHDLGSYLARWSGLKETAGPAPGAEPPASPYGGTYRRQPPNKPAPGPSWHRRSAEPSGVDKDEVNAKLSELGGYTHVMKTVDRNFIESMIEAFDQFGDNAKCSPAQRDWVDGLYRNFVESKSRGRRR